MTTISELWGQLLWLMVTALIVMLKSWLDRRRQEKKISLHDDIEQLRVGQSGLLAYVKQLDERVVNLTEFFMREVLLNHRGHGPSLMEPFHNRERHEPTGGVGEESRLRSAAGLEPLA